MTGLFNVLRELDILAGSPVENGKTRDARNHLGNVDATDSGLFRVTADYELGETIPEGSTLGTVYDPTTYETLQTVRTEREGVLYALTREATVTVGDRLAGIAVVD